MSIHPFAAVRQATLAPAAAPEPAPQPPAAKEVPVSTPPAPTPKPFKIEAVITCVNHSDFLAHTLPLNLRHFDKIVVVTSPGDKGTQKVCEYHGVQVKLTDKFREQWGEFRKGAGINEGLAELDKDAWIVHMDADIVLPPHFRKFMVEADLDTTMIYGVDRAEFKSYEEWQRFIAMPEPPIQGAGFFIHTDYTGKKLGTRVAFAHHGHYICIGFFQCWHHDSGVFTYPEGHTDAGREDAVFPTQWPRRKRALIPEIIVCHLESEDAPMSVNWRERKTKKFGVGE